MLGAVLERLPIEVIHVVPAAVPPLRPQPVADAEHRVAMVHIAVSGTEGLFCDRREIDRDGISYTLLTVREMLREMPACRLALILGRDAFDKLPRWHGFDELRTLVDFVVINRPGFDAAASPPPWMAGKSMATGFDLDAPPGRVVALEIPPSDISATELRRRLADDEDVSDMLPPDVYAYIREHRLYA